MVAFGALVAAGVPLLLAVTGVAATLGLVGPISHIAAVDQTISNVVLLIGLAVGVDRILRSRARAAAVEDVHEVPSRSDERPALATPHGAKAS